jgi:hypothetical protein
MVNPAYRNAAGQQRRPVLAKKKLYNIEAIQRMTAGRRKETLNVLANV